MRKYPGLCSGPGYGWTHCPLFSKLLVTLGQLDGTSWLPWAWSPPRAHGRQPGWRDSTQSLIGLERVPFPWGAPSVLSEPGTPSLAIWGARGP